MSNANTFTQQSAIRNHQSQIDGCLTRPGSQQLGAKWVEVTKPAGKGDS